MYLHVFALCTPYRSNIPKHERFLCFAFFHSNAVSYQEINWQNLVIDKFITAPFAPTACRDTVKISQRRLQVNLAANIEHV
jgi:hypothetical protein